MLSPIFIIFSQGAQIMKSSQRIYTSILVDRTCMSVFSEHLHKLIIART